LLFLGGYKYVLFFLMGSQKADTSDMQLTFYGLGGAFTTLLGRLATKWLSQRSRLFSPTAILCTVLFV